MIYEKRGQWCWRDSTGKLYKFRTEEEAIGAAGFPMPQAELEPLSSWLEDLDDAEEESE